MKRLLSLVLLGLMLGLVVSPALASTESVPEQTPTVQQIPTCPCCSGNVTMVRNVKVEVLEGPTAYFKAIQVFNTKDSIKLREYLKDQKLIPLYRKAVVLIAKHNGTTTEIVKVPLVGRNNGQLVYVRNKYGEAVAVGVYSSGSIKAYIIEGGTIKELERPIETQGFKDWAKCTVCTAVVGGICKIGINIVTSAGCGWLCAGICALFTNPVLVAACGVFCVPICKRAVSVISWAGCGYGAYRICQRIGYC